MPRGSVMRVVDSVPFVVVPILLGPRLTAIISPRRSKILLQIQKVFL